MKRPIAATNAGLSGRLVLIIITVTVAAGGFILGYFVGKNVYTMPLIQQSLPKPAGSESPIPPPETKKIQEVVPTPPEQNTTKEEGSAPADPSAETEPPKPFGSGQHRAAGANFLPARDTVNEKAAMPKPAGEPIKVEDRQAQSDTDSHAAVYAVQVGAFKSRREADTLKAGLEAKGYKTQSRKTVVKGKPLFKVVVGEVSTEKEAELLALKLKKAEGLHAFVVQEN